MSRRLVELAVDGEAIGRMVELAGFLASVALGVLVVELFRMVNRQ